jgi:hypothetical protein
MVSEFQFWLCPVQDVSADTRYLIERGTIDEHTESEYA